MARRRIGDLLVDTGVITPEQLNFALKNKLPDEKIGDVLLREEFITEQQLIEVLEFQLGIPHVNLHQFRIDQEMLQLVPKELAKRYRIMPIRKEKNKLFVAMEDPTDYFAIEELRMATGYHIEPAIASRDDLNRYIAKYYDLQESMEQILNDQSFNLNAMDDTKVTDENSPVVRLVNQIILDGLNQNASDIHFDPQDGELRVRYRIDGFLRTERTLPKNMQNVINARIKIMSNLNITETRLPQDGRIKSSIHYRAVDIRVSVIPTVFGEKIVMRLLDLSKALNNFDKIGFTNENLQMFKDMLARPNGIVLITGPTGSGKSSTLYAGLNYLNSEKVNIITVEDPVEYQLDGINQIQVNEDIGLTFASGLRSILRQDPDIIMIGEIRDTETAEIATRASLTGHLVLSTLHTNSSLAAIARLRDMGIQPYLISSSLVGIVAQRLVRRVCKNCEESVVPLPKEQEILASYGIHTSTVKKGKGCSVCNHTGYRGRIAIHEVLLIDERLRELIMEEAHVARMNEHMHAEGMKSLMADGLLKVKEGLTTVEEILRVSALD